MIFNFQQVFLISVNAATLTLFSRNLKLCTLPLSHCPPLSTTWTSMSRVGTWGAHICPCDLVDGYVAVVGYFLVETVDCEGFHVCLRGHLSVHL